MKKRTLPAFIHQDRQQFVSERYDRFKAKKTFLDSIDPLREHSYLTDLDAEKNGMLLKDVVLCDACNENIIEDAFVFLENSYTYHPVCVLGRPWYKAPLLPNNVIPLFPIRTS